VSKKTSELTGAALDWAVCHLEGEQMSQYTRYSTDWSQGGPIIEREAIGFWKYQFDAKGNENPGWYAEKFDGFFECGPTPLIAAMRCYVVSRLGDTIDIPSDLE
jgi:hypothetical protein